ncbi:MAG: hypothetical protein COA79_24385 [Planctomycetota bacterium]|nr:MAG: hypothetical protein COA79_24385 [Planctomycetota bacterium]
MSLPISEIESVSCKYCQIDLNVNDAGSVGFVTCPECKKSFLKLPANVIPFKDFDLSLSRKKVVDLFPTKLDTSVEVENLNRNLHAEKNKNENLVLQHNQEFREKNIELDDLKEEMESVHSELEKLSSKNEELRMQVSENIFEYDRVCRTLGEKNAILIQAKSDYEKAKEKLEQKASMCTALEKEEGFKSRTLLSANEDISELSIEIEEYKNNFISLQKLVLEKQSKIQELEINLAIVPEFEIEIDNAMAKIQQIQKKIDEGFLETVGIDQIEILNDEVSILRQECLDNENVINELKEKNDKLSSDNNSEGDDINFISNQHAVITSNELSIAKAKEEQLQHANDKLESLTIEFDITRGDLENAKSEINELNSSLEKAFYENQKHSDTDNNKKKSAILVAREIEIREEKLATQAKEYEEVIAKYKAQLNGQKNLKNALIVKRINSKGASKESIIFGRNISLPSKGLELRKSVRYAVNKNKGQFEFYHDDGRGAIIDQFSVNFGSNLQFFLNVEEFENLDDNDVEVAIQEEYVLDSEGQLTVYFYRNNGFKFFERRIGVVLVEEN